MQFDGNDGDITLTKEDEEGKPDARKDQLTLPVFTLAL
jgi:hypothetical protein